MSETKLFCVYIVTNQFRGTLYTGVTSGLKIRIWQHREKMVPGFSAQYGLSRLVYYEICGSALAAIAREKQIKAGSRSQKIRLIAEKNPKWKDLYSQL